MVFLYNKAKQPDWFFFQTKQICLSTSFACFMTFENILILKISIAKSQAFLHQLHTCLVWLILILLVYLHCPSLVLFWPRLPLSTFLCSVTPNLPPSKLLSPILVFWSRSKLPHIWTYTYVTWKLGLLMRPHGSLSFWWSWVTSLNIVFSSFIHFPANFTFPHRQIKSHCG